MALDKLCGGLPENPYEKTDAKELRQRLSRLREAVSKADPQWEMIFLEEKVDQFYFTGTMQDGALVVTPKDAVYFVRRDFACAQQESNFPDIRPMHSFRELQAVVPKPIRRLYVDTENLSLKKLQMLSKYLSFAETADVNGILSDLRAHKSDWEIRCMEKAGQMHAEVIDGLAPALLRKQLLAASAQVQQGVAHTEAASVYTEALFCVDLARELIARGAMGVSRFHQALAEDALGVCSVGENALKHSGFDSPTGEVGTSIAMKAIGSAKRVIQAGDLILLDIPSNFLGYNTDKSKNYYVMESVAGEGTETKEKRALIQTAHDNCVFIEQETAKLLKPGAVPQELYENALKLVDPAFREGFMNGAKFLGHSVGLCMDEKPVLAKGFLEPLAANMTLALEPKIALPGIGLAGTENTYLIQESGAARSLTGAADSPWMVAL